MSLEAVQARAGHASIESTRIYHYTWAMTGWPPSTGGQLRPSTRRRSPLPPCGCPVTGPALLPDSPQLAGAIPQIADPMRRYPEQVACVLRPGSVSGADLALRRVPHRGIPAAPPR